MRLTLTGRGRGIAPANLQAALDSAANAAQKGQAQYHTPLTWGQMLALPLPGYRPVLVDLTCGSGQLLAAAAGPGTHHCLGCDLEDVRADDLADTPARRLAGSHFIQADLTLLADYLQRAHWSADLFVLNFPWDLHWYRERLRFLADSDCAAVATAFAAHDGRTSKDTIDSTVAGLCLALDRCSPYGEGLVIANHATVQRLIFAPNAPHSVLRAHVWARVTLPGNVCQASVEPGAPSAEPGSPFQTDVLYFARGHRGGPARHLHSWPAADLQTAVAGALKELASQRLALRAGPYVRTYAGGHTPDTVSLWDAVALEWRTVQAANRPGDARWNIWLQPNGTLGTNLTPFQATQPILKDKYLRLHALRGRHPMQLVLQTAERKELQAVVHGDTWRVEPRVLEAVAAALAEYHAVRAPLYPLNPIQRLGYLDEQDTIRCRADLGPFRAGQDYPVETMTVRIKRSGQKLNLEGGVDEVLWEGSDLAIYLKDAEGVRHLFMEERLRGDDVRLSIQRDDEPSPIEFTLQALADHFDVPEVPDVSTRDPAGYQRNLDLLTTLERIVNASS